MINRCVLQFLAEINIPYWVEWGSLIGFMRHKGITPWDSDMDVGVLDTDYDYLKENIGRI